MDVTPRSLTDLTNAEQPTGSGPSRPRRGRGRWRGVVLSVVVVAALGFVVARGLGNATLYFRNADEAVAQRQNLGEDRFRLQGSVLDGTVVRRDGGARFTVSYGGVDVVVDHQGEIPRLFEPGIPVVLEGHWQGDVFVSDRMLVKHSEVYVEQNPARVGAYEGAAS